MAGGWDRQHGAFIGGKVTGLRERHDALRLRHTGMERHGQESIFDTTHGNCNRVSFGRKGSIFGRKHRSRIKEMRETRCGQWSMKAIILEIPDKASISTRERQAWFR